jgi:hypothetical protein
LVADPFKTKTSVAVATGVMSIAVYLKVGFGLFVLTHKIDPSLPADCGAYPEDAPVICDVPAIVYTYKSNMSDSSSSNSA